MSKIIEFGPEARRKLSSGVDKLSNAVTATLGPNGRNVVISKPGEYPQSTKDGVTVAKAITLEDPIEELGVQMVKQAAIKTAETAGDGTTTSTLLAQEMVKQGLTYLNNGANAVEIKRSIDVAVKDVLKHIREEIKENISSEDQLKQVASISANNDPAIGELIATAMQKVGREGVVHIEESKSGETYLETVEGMQFDRGYKSPYFVTDNNNMSSTLNDVLVLILDKKITQVKELLPILESVSAQNKSLLIVAEDIEGEALATLIVNKARGILKVCAVKAPDFGDRRKLILEDLAVLTGGQVFSTEKGMKLDRFDMNWFGKAKTVTVGKETTTIVDGKGDTAKIDARISELKSQIEGSNSPYEVERLQDRLAKIIGGVAVIYVGGGTEVEMRERKDRIDDALQATKAALEEGILPGAGVALLNARNSISNRDNSDFGKGGQIVFKACTRPFYQILKNAGEDIFKWEINLYQAVDNNAVPNISEEKLVDAFESGIIDPTKVVRCALENAAAAAVTLLMTECVIHDKPTDKKKDEFDMSSLGM